MDNLLHVHDHPRLLALLRRLHLTPVFTPTNVSWLQLSEAQFGVMKRATRNPTDEETHQVRRRRLARYRRYRNRKKGPHRHPLTRMRTVQDLQLDPH
jgi:transposase